MSDSSPQRIQELFHAACERPPATRKAFLRAACGSEAHLFNEVMSLLEHLDIPLQEWDGNNSTFMEWTDAEVSPAAPQKAAETPSEAEISFAGYEILERIGEGGMGIVFSAMQDRPRRKLALKVIRGGTANRALAQRLRLEAELLGRLKHPGIAQVIEAGEVETPLGPQPFIAMELIEGMDLLQHAESHGLSLVDRISLMIKMSEAVHHAHMHGIIHRDLKPANIIVEPSGQPKILDFGIARIDDDDRLNESLHTQAGQVIGTLNYMSPEQAEGSSHALDTRADIYALGAIAFELISGRPARNLKELDLSEALQHIRTGAPPSLSQWRRDCRGDLETVITKAMAVDPSARYAAASEFAADLKRVLQHEPIQARPPSARYQLRMLARRHRPLVVSLIGVFLALVVGLATTLWQAREAREANGKAILAQSEAEAEAQTAEEVIHFLTEDVIAAAHPNRLGAKAGIVEAILEARASAKQRISDPDVSFRIHEMLGETLNGLSLWDEAQEDYRVAYELKCQSAGRDSEAALSTLVKIAETQEKKGELRESIKTAQDALNRIQDNPAISAATHAFALNTLAWSLRQVGDFDAAFTHASEALAIRSRIDTAPTEGKAVALNDLAILAQDRNDLQTAESMLRQSLNIRRELYGDQHSSIAQSLNNLGLLQMRKGQLKESAAALRESLQVWKALDVESSPRVAITTLNLYYAIEPNLTRNAEAHEVAQRAQSMAQTCLPETHPLQIRTLSSLAESLANLGRFQESLIPASKALMLCLAPGRRSPALLAPTLWLTGQALTETGAVKEGEKHLRAALKDCQSKKQHRAARSAIVRTLLAQNLMAQERYEEAESLLLATLDPIQNGQTSARINLKSAKAHLTTLYQAWGRPERIRDLNLP